jgi:hypothetical protein
LRYFVICETCFIKVVLTEQKFPLLKVYMSDATFIAQGIDPLRFLDHS